MEEYKTAAYACFIACEDKTRKFLYNDDGVFEGIWSGYDKIGWNNFKQIVGKEAFPVHTGNEELNIFLNSLKFGHDIFGKDKTHTSKDLPLFQNPLPHKPINPESS